MRIFDRLLGRGKSVDEIDDSKNKMAAQEIEDLLARVVKGKEILQEWEKNKTILSHTQLHLLATSLGLEIGHYSAFLGTMPVDKIFKMPKLNTSKKVYCIAKHYDADWTGIDDIVESGIHAPYLTVSELENVKGHFKELNESGGSNKKITALFVEYPAVFILAPEELFTEDGKSLLLDPIMVEMIGDDQYQVCSFWNVPEKVATQISNPNYN